VSAAVRSFPFIAMVTQYLPTWPVAVR